MKAWLMRGVSTSKEQVRPVYQENIHNDYEAAPQTPYLPMGRSPPPKCFPHPAVSRPAAAILLSPEVTSKAGSSGKVTEREDSVDLEDLE